MNVSIKSLGVVLVGLLSAGAKSGGRPGRWPTRGCAAPSGQKATGAFMQLSSRGRQPGGVASPAAKVVEIHEMVMDNNVMKMRALPRLEVGGRQGAGLKPGSYHVMLIDLKPLAKGEIVPITCRWKARTRRWRPSR